MARTTIVQLTDDLDGSRADRTVSFAWNGKSYELDLSKRNASALEKTLAPYIDAGRVVRSGRAPARKSSATGTGREELSAIREWAKSQGHQVSNRGRIPASVVEAYNAAH
jgi:Lsr2